MSLRLLFSAAQAAQEASDLQAAQDIASQEAADYMTAQEVRHGSMAAWAHGCIAAHLRVRVRRHAGVPVCICGCQSCEHAVACFVSRWHEIRWMQANDLLAAQDIAAQQTADYIAAQEVRA